MHKLTVELVLFWWLIMWLFNQISLLSQPVKDVINIVAIVLILIMGFVL